MGDDQQIVRQLYELASATDRREWNRLAELLLPDAHAYGQDGLDDIVSVMRRHLDGCGPTQHLLANPRVWVDGDTARSATYARVYHQGGEQKPGRFFECMGEYDDHWTRTPHGWRLASRAFDMQITLGDFDVLRAGE